MCVLKWYWLEIKKKINIIASKRKGSNFWAYVLLLLCNCVKSSVRLYLCQANIHMLRVRYKGNRSKLKMRPWSFIKPSTNTTCIVINGHFFFFFFFERALTLSSAGLFVVNKIYSNWLVYELLLLPRVL